MHTGYDTVSLIIAYFECMCRRFLEEQYYCQYCKVSVATRIISNSGKMNYWLMYMCCLWLWSEKFGVLVSADYLLEVELESFSNPSNRRLNGQCCDQMNSSDCTVESERCDTYFIFCLRIFDTATNGCPNGTVLTSGNAINSNFINFSQPTALGLTNPFKLSGLSPEWLGVQLYIEPYDFNDDGSGDNRLNIYSFNILETNPVGTQIRINNSNGFTGSTSLTLHVTVLCASFYSGVRCQTLDNCGFNNVTCNGRGVCMDEINDYTCNCNPPYFGQNCELEDFCFGKNCSGRGNCSHGINYFNCSCDPGYTGERCEVDIDECAVVNCSGNGECVDGVNSFNCQCVSGFTGELCNNTEIERRGASRGVVEGVVSSVVVLLLLIIVVIVVLVVLFLSKRARREKTIQYSESQNVPQSSSYIPGDNPVYGVPEHKTDTITSEMVEFDNPIYGSDNDIADEDSIEVDNPIYGDADFEDDSVHVYEQTNAVNVSSEIPSGAIHVYDHLQNNK